MSHSEVLLSTSLWFCIILSRYATPVTVRFDSLRTSYRNILFSLCTERGLEPSLADSHLTSRRMCEEYSCA
ncbi:hypothetical protein DFH11DRAFT_163144 [Phellopilus nigrolimitatus]|nr:hypothetical protein DFH11DRAFT_163144 [Phellopilus nigrolimitatus]